MAMLTHERNTLEDPPVFRLRVVAQTPADWLDWTEALTSCLAAERTFRPEGHARACRWNTALVGWSDIETAWSNASVEGRTRWIVLVDAPARFLASRLRQSPDATPHELLKVWHAAASQALAWVHRLRGHCVVFDADEAAASPISVAQSLAGWLGVDLPEDGWNAPASPDALLLRLAAEFAATDKTAMALWQELQACCMPLPEASDGVIRPDTRTDGAAADLLKLRSLLAAASQLPVLASVLAERKSQVETLQRRAQELEAVQERDAETLRALESRLRAEHERADQDRRAGEQRLAQESESLRAMETQLAEAKSESEMLLAQLHQVQEELEALLLQQQRAAQLDSERTARATELDSLKRDFAQHSEQNEREKLALQGQLQSERAARERVEAALARMESDHKRAEASLVAEAKDAKEEADLILVQLHHVQEELETHYFALQATRRELADAAEAASVVQAQPAVSGLLATARQRRVVAVRELPPHRELDLELRDVTLGSVTLPQVSIRLVEHEGRPGIALLALPGLAPPVTQWSADGEDGGGAFMLFIPADAGGRSRLAQLGTRNWQVLLGLAALAYRVTVAEGTVLAPYWPTVASRLGVELNALPARLRYDAMRVEQDGEAISLRLDGVCFGSRLLPAIEVRWTPGARDATLRWLRTDQQTPSLSAWPVQADGQLVADWVLPLGGQTPLSERMRWWTQLLPTDRDLVLAVVDTLSAIPAQLPTLEDKDRAQRDRIGREARRLRNELRRTLFLGHLARRLRPAGRRPQI